MSSTWTGWEPSTTFPASQACSICSNGPVTVYHYGGPCPYLYPAQRSPELPDGEYRVMGGMLFRIMPGALPILEPPKDGAT